jgi:hypothetical protein
MAKKERNRGSVDRARAKRGSGQANQEPEMRFMDVPAGMPAGEPAPTRPTPRPARGSNLAPTSTRDKPVAAPCWLWQSEQTFAKPWTLLMPRSAPLSVKPPTVRDGR